MRFSSDPKVAESSDDPKRCQDETHFEYSWHYHPSGTQLRGRPYECFTTGVSRAVEVLDDVCALLLKLYQAPEKTSPMAFQSYHQNLINFNLTSHFPDQRRTCMNLSRILFDSERGDL